MNEFNIVIALSENLTYSVFCINLRSLESIDFGSCSNEQASYLLLSIAFLKVSVQYKIASIVEKDVRNPH